MNKSTESKTLLSEEDKNIIKTRKKNLFKEHKWLSGIGGVIVICITLYTTYIVPIINDTTMLMIDFGNIRGRADTINVICLAIKEGKVTNFDDNSLLGETVGEILKRNKIELGEAIHKAVTDSFYLVNISEKDKVPYINFITQNYNQLNEMNFTGQCPETLYTSEELVDQQRKILKSLPLTTWKVIQNNWL